MKKIFSFLLAFSLTGCNLLSPQPPATEQATQQLTQETTQQAEELLPADTMVSWITGLDTQIHEIKSEDPEFHWSVEVRYPQFVASERTKILEKINQKIKAVKEDDVESFGAEQIARDIGELELASSESFYTAEPTVSIIGENLLSIRFDASLYSAGAAHPMGYISTMNFDLANGEEFQLSDVFMDDYLPALSALSIQQLKETLAAEEDLEEWIEAGAAPLPENFGPFTLTDTAIVLYFNPYQVAPYAAGPQTVIIPYSEVEEFINGGGPLRHLGYFP